jgi:aminomethyltransferase
MSQKTPLFDEHCRANAKMVDFAGWQMPLHYGSQLTEHVCVRERAGVFDVSHMGVIDVKGLDVVAFCRYVFANDVAKLKSEGDALYTCMLNAAGGVIDDLIVYRFNDNYYRLIVNAGCRDKDFEWLSDHAKKFDVTLAWRNDVCLLAVQGPQAIDALAHVFNQAVSNAVHALKPFQSHSHNDIVIARTGYTGEPGVEIMLPSKDVVTVWNALLANGVSPCGLGARDTLRLEAGFNLYGNDMTESTSPLISNLSWTVSFKDTQRDFVGKSALLSQKENGIDCNIVGLVMKDRGVMRQHQAVKTTEGAMGEITSGGFSPTLGYSIAMARIPNTSTTQAFIERRGEWLPVDIVSMPFIKKSTGE